MFGLTDGWDIDAAHAWLKSWSSLIPGLHTVCINHGYNEEFVYKDNIRQTDTYYGNSIFWEKQISEEWLPTEWDENASERANHPDPFGC
jgi:hypothetical protein